MIQCISSSQFFLANIKHEEMFSAEVKRGTIDQSKTQTEVKHIKQTHRVHSDQTFDALLNAVGFLFKGFHEQNL